MKLRRPLLAALITLTFAGASAAAAAVALGSNSPHATAARATGRSQIGPGPATVKVQEEGYRVELRLSPNKAAARSKLSVKLTRQGQPISGARVRAAFTMLDMHMPGRSAPLVQSAPGRYDHAAPRLMFGRWGLRLHVQPQGAKPFSISFVDRVGI